MSKSIWEWVKLKAPNSKGQGKGAIVDSLTTSIPISRFEDMIQTLSSNAVSSEMKQKYAKGSLTVSCCTNGFIGSKGTIIA